MSLAALWADDNEIGRNCRSRRDLDGSSAEAKVLDCIHDTYLPRRKHHHTSYSRDIPEVDGRPVYGSEGRFVGWPGTSLRRLVVTGRRPVLYDRQEKRMDRIHEEDGGAHPWLTVHIALSFHRSHRRSHPRRVPLPVQVRCPLEHGLAGLTTWLLIASSASEVFGRYIYRKLPALKKTLSYWKPAHVLMTGLLFFAAIFYMLTAFGD